MQYGRVRGRSCLDCWDYALLRRRAGNGLGGNGDRIEVLGVPNAATVSGIVLGNDEAHAIHLLKLVRDVPTPTVF